MEEHFDGGDYIDEYTLPNSKLDTSKPFSVSFWVKSFDSAMHGVFKRDDLIVKAKVQSGSWHHVVASYEYGQLTNLTVNVLFPWYRRFYYWLFPKMREPTEIQISGLNIK